MPIFYSGSRLAPDLSLPRLMQVWGVAGRGRDVADPWSVARRRVEGARRAVHAARHGQVVEDPDGLAHATHSLLTALQGTSAEWARVVDRYDRAARPPHGARVREGARAVGSRRVARQLVRQRRLLGVADEPGAAGLALAVALLALIREIAAWQRDHGRAHQADAALSAADALICVTAGQSTAAIDDLVIPASAATAHRPRIEPHRGHSATAPTTADARLA